MNNEDIDRFLESLKRKGFLNKISAIIIFIISLGSLADLTSTIIEIRGLLKDGVDIYQLHVIGAVVKIAKFIGMELSIDEINAGVLASIGIAASTKVIIQGQKVAYNEINNIHGTDYEPKFWVLRAVNFIGILFMWGYYGFFDSSDNLIKSSLAFVFCPFLIVLVKLIMNFFMDGAYYEREKYSYVKSYYKFLFVLFCTLLILIAISNGLTAELTS